VAIIIERGHHIIDLFEVHYNSLLLLVCNSIGNIILAIHIVDLELSLIQHSRDLDLSSIVGLAFSLFLDLLKDDIVAITKIVRLVFKDTDHFTLNSLNIHFGGSFPILVDDGKSFSKGSNHSAENTSTLGQDYFARDSRGACHILCDKY